MSTNTGRIVQTIKRLSVGALSLALLLVPGVGSPGVAEATSPGHNGRVVFVGRTTEGRQLFTLRFDGHGVRQITHVAVRSDADSPGATASDWSPDGSRIVFTLNDCQMALINADGSGMTLVPTPPGTHPGIDWCEGGGTFMPDGQHLAFGSFDGEREVLSRMRLDGSERTLITAAGCCSPNVSPDGNQLSFKVADDGRIFVANIDGTGITPVSPDGNMGGKSDWAPDGSRVAFSDNDEPAPGESENMITVRPDGSDLQYVTHFSGGARARIGSYSPDGRWIIFRLDDQNGSALYVVHPDGSAMRQIGPALKFGAGWIDWGARARP